MAAVSLTVSTVKPLGDRIFIKVSASEEKTAGGILLPDSAKEKPQVGEVAQVGPCLLYTSPSPRDRQKSRMPSSA